MNCVNEATARSIWDSDINPEGFAERFNFELNALDTNIIDSDFFEGRTNMQGVFLAAVYCPTDAILFAMRFGDAYRVKADGPTPGSNPDLSNVQPINRYKLLQLDFGWKF